MSQNVQDPGLDFVPVTPSDAVDLADGDCRALYIETGGTLIVIPSGQKAAGTNRTIAGIADGTLLPLQCSRVIATGTTATGIHAIY